MFPPLFLLLCLADEKRKTPTLNNQAHMPMLPQQQRIDPVFRSHPVIPFAHLVDRDRWTRILSELTPIAQRQTVLQGSRDLGSLISRTHYMADMKERFVLDTSGLESVLDGYWLRQGEEGQKQQLWSTGWRSDFLESVVPFLANLVLQSEDLFPATDTSPSVITPLWKQQDATVSLSRVQCACILSNAFFCTFVRASVEQCWHLINFPSINYDDMLSSNPNGQAKMAKLAMLLNYFIRVSRSMPLGRVVLERRVLTVEKLCGQAMQDSGQDGSLQGRLQKALEERLKQLDGDSLPQTFRTEPNLPIESDIHTLQADFANAFVGGASLSYGCVQEEIKFSQCPELNVARLYSERLEDNEALIISGAEQFSSSYGYKYNLRFAGDFVELERAQDGGSLQMIVVIDAMQFRGPAMMREQFCRRMISREIIKVCAGIMHLWTNTCKEDTIHRRKRVFATGNWGCGAFGGDKMLKACIQLIAAGISGLDVVYHTFGDKELADQLDKVVKLLRESNRGTLWLYETVTSQLEDERVGHSQALPNTFAFIAESILGSITGKKYGKKKFIDLKKRINDTEFN